MEEVKWELDTFNHAVMKRWMFIGIGLLLVAASAHAQLKGSHLLGQVGLESATQGPPGLDLLVLPAYLYNTGEIKGNDGNVLANNFSLNSYAAAAGLAWVFNKKILGGNLGGSFFLPFVTNKIQSNVVNQTSSFAFSDSYLQPFQLGWHTKRVDYMAAFNLYIPTGSYSAGGSDNSGLGMWGYEFSAGATVYFDPKKTWSFAALFSYELNSKKKGTDTRVGDLLSIEGGLGKTFYKKTKGPIPIIINAGVAYYMQFKTTPDQISLDSSLVISGKSDHVYGLGPEGNIFLPGVKSLVGLRWVFETGAVDRFQGRTFLVTWVYKIK
jgi:hypothetical protein